MLPAGAHDSGFACTVGVASETVSPAKAPETTAHRTAVLNSRRHDPM